MRLRAGKLPPDLLRRVIERVPAADPRVLIGPALGRDATAIESADRFLVVKTDPITFATDEIGWYVVQVNANDIACLGARPLWFMLTSLLPEGCDEQLPLSIASQVVDACAALGVAFVGGHTEVTLGLDRPILCGTMLGEAAHDSLIRPGGARAGDAILLTKGIPLEGACVIAREKSDDLRARGVSPQVVERARAYLHEPGIGVTIEARIAARSGASALHDPTEGGVATAIWEFCESNGLGAQISRAAIPVLPEAQRLCDAYALDPLGMIASGSLLIAIDPSRETALRFEIENAGITCARVGYFVEHGLGVSLDDQPMPRFDADEVTKVFA